jgi:hypothetical protein
MTRIEWSELMPRVRSAMNSRGLAVAVFIIGGSLFTSALLGHPVMIRTGALLLLQVGLFVGLAGAAFCFAASAQKATPLSVVLFTIWEGLIVVAFFKFGWKAGFLSVVLSVVYFLVGGFCASYLTDKIHWKETSPDSTEPPMKSSYGNPKETKNVESVRPPLDWAGMTKDHWKRFHLQMYVELENAGLLDEAADEAAKNIQALIDARTKSNRNQQIGCEPRTNLSKAVLLGLAKLGGHYYDRGMTDFPTWSNHMRARIGKGVEPYIDTVWQAVTGAKGRIETG